MKELIEIQNQLKVLKSNYNEFGNFNFRSAEDILQEVKPLLAKNNLLLTLTDEVKSVGEYTFIEATCRLVKPSTGNKKEEFIETKAQAGITKFDRMNIAQSFGSSSSYARKYSMQAMFLLDDGKDADPDSPNQSKKADNKTETKKRDDQESQSDAIQKAKIILSEFEDAKYLDKNKAGVRDEIVEKLKLKKSLATNLVIGRINELTKGKN
jgi:hypothetical protein